MWERSKVGSKLLGVTLFSLLVALVGLLLVMQYLATHQILEWHRQRVELVARLVLAEYIGKIHRVEQAANLLADMLGGYQAAVVRMNAKAYQLGARSTRAGWWRTVTREGRRCATATTIRGGWWSN